MKERIEKLIDGDTCPEILTINSTDLAVFNDGHVCLVLEVKEWDSEYECMRMSHISDPYIRKIAHYILAGICAEKAGTLDFDDNHIDAVCLDWVQSR